MHLREWHVARRSSLAGIHQSENSVMLDCPAVDRQRRREGAGQEQVQLATRTMAGEQEALLDADGSGRESVNLHDRLSFGVGDLVSRLRVGAKPARIRSTTPSARRSSIGPPVTSRRKNRAP